MNQSRFEMPERWAKRIFKRLNQANKDWALPDANKATATYLAWAEATSMRWKTRDRCAKMINYGIKATLATCRFQPTIADFIAEAEQAALDDGFMQHGTTGAVNTISWRDDAVKSPRQMLEHLSKHAKSEVAQAELEKMRRILAGENAETVTGMTMDEHRRVCGVT